MYNPDEKDIDRLSREAAEHYRAPGKPAWDALQQLLDKELPQEKEKKRRGFFFFFLLFSGFLLLGSATWYGIGFLTTHKTPDAGKANKTLVAKDKPVQENQTVAVIDKQPDGINNSSTGSIAANPLPASSVVPAGTLSAKMTESHNSQDAVANVDVLKSSHPVASTGKKAPATVNHNVTDLSVVTSKKKLTSHNKTAYDIPANRLVKNTPKNSRTMGTNTITNGGLMTYPDNFVARTPKQGGQKTKNTSIPATKDRLRNKTSNDYAGAALGDENRVDTDTVRAGILTENDTITNINKYVPAGSQDTAEKQPVAKDTANVKSEPTIGKKDAVARKKTSTKQSGLVIGLTAGADFSTVRFTHGDNAGYNIGLMGGYQFTKHWSLYTGIIYTKKNYLLNGSDYHPPKHYWTTYVKLETVDGYCRMWELPLLARYTFNPGSKTAFFASTGLSSYFMKKQQYNYSYKNNMNQLVTTPWSNDSSFNHTFSILHLSVGFEKSIGKHLNWQVEPYAKIPLGGVGFGNIRLSSFGINFSVQYSKALRR